MSTTRVRRSPVDPAAQPWSGREREYDLVKELVIALAAVTSLTLLLAALFSSPDVPQVTIATWSRSAPADFVRTAAAELDGSSGTATYGAPYDHVARRGAVARAAVPAAARRRDAPGGHRAGLRGRAAAAAAR